jgi:hypothetical protein
MQRVSAVISILAAKEIRQQGAISASSQQLGECRSQYERAFNAIIAINTTAKPQPNNIALL